jgi:hypothetical protein
MRNSELRTIYKGRSSPWGQSLEYSHSSGLVHKLKRKWGRLDELPMRVWADWWLVMGIEAIFYQ